MTGEITRKGGKPYGIVPFDLLECRSLSTLARLVAVWIESKPEGWVVRPSVLQTALGISEKQWLSARRAMISIGIFTHNKYRKADGTWEWKSVFDATPILRSIPPSAARGEAADIDIREKEIRNQGIQKTEATFAYAQAAPLGLSTSTANKSDLNHLKTLHLGFVLDDLEIDWWTQGNYIHWGDYFRARQLEDGHWLWIEADGRSSGSAIDLIMAESLCSQAKAINRLRSIYREALKKATHQTSS